MVKTQTVGSRRKSLKRPFSSNGFTIVELLIVVAIIATLAAVVLPVVTYARELGRRTTCQTNLRQIAAAMQQYTQDYDGLYPQETFACKTDNVTTLLSWRDVLLPYTKSRELFQCPTQSQALLGDSYTLNIERLNTLVGQKPFVTVHGTHESLLPCSSTTWLNVDKISVKNGECVNCNLSMGSCGRAFYASTLHRGGGNYSFIDGHVKWFAPETIAELDCQNGPLLPPSNH